MSNVECCLPLFPSFMAGERFRTEQETLLGPLPAPSSRGEEEERGSRREGGGSDAGRAGAGIPGSRQAAGAFMLVGHLPERDGVTIQNVLG